MAEWSARSSSTLTTTRICFTVSPEIESSAIQMRSRQSESSMFVITVKRITPNFVPWGTPSFSVSQSDKVLPILTACVRYVKKR